MRSIRGTRCAPWCTGNGTGKQGIWPPPPRRAAPGSHCRRPPVPWRPCEKPRLALAARAAPQPAQAGLVGTEPHFNGAAPGRRGFSHGLQGSLLLRLLQISPQFYQHAGGKAISLTDEPQKEVLGANIVVIELPRLFISQVDDPLGARR